MECVFDEGTREDSDSDDLEGDIYFFGYITQRNDKDEELEHALYHSETEVSNPEDERKDLQESSDESKSEKDGYKDALVETFEVLNRSLELYKSIGEVSDSTTEQEEHFVAPVSSKNSNSNSSLGLSFSSNEDAYDEPSEKKGDYDDVLANILTLNTSQNNLSSSSGSSTKEGDWRRTSIPRDKSITSTSSSVEIQKSSEEITSENSLKTSVDSNSPEAQSPIGSIEKRSKRRHHSVSPSRSALTRSQSKMQQKEFEKFIQSKDPIALKNAILNFVRMHPENTLVFQNLLSSEVQVLKFIYKIHLTINM